MSKGTGNSIQLNGGRTSAVDYYVDGGVVNSGQANRLTNQVPSMDAVSEFRVVTAGISAEYGRISGGYVTLVTKGGTNTIRGSAYQYMFDDALNANSWAQNAIGAKKADFRQNNSGYTVGGPGRHTRPLRWTQQDLLFRGQRVFQAEAVRHALRSAACRLPLKGPGTSLRRPSTETCI